MSYPKELFCKVYLAEQQKVVKKILANSKNLKHILEQVSKITNIPISLLKSKSKERYLSEARAAYGIIAKERNSEDKMSLTKIGSEINRDHATISHYNNNLCDIPAIVNIINRIK